MKKYKLLSVIMLTLAVSLIAGRSKADDGSDSLVEDSAPAAPAAVKAAAPPFAQPAAPEPAAVPAEDGSVDTVGYNPEEVENADAMSIDATKISVTLDEVPLDDVVGMFTKIADINIIVSSSNLYDKTVTVNLKNVGWRPALNSILDTHGMALVEQSEGVFTIVDKVPGEVVPMNTKPFKLYYVTVADVTGIVQSMLPIEPPGASISQFPQQNILIVKSTDENLTKIEQLIRELDQPSKQVSIETKFMELSDEASEQLGIKWSSLEEFGAQMQLGPFSRTEDLQHTLTRNDALNEYDARRKTDVFHQSFDANGTPIDDTGTGDFIGPATTLAADGTTVLESQPGTIIGPTRSIQDSIDQGKEVGTDIVDAFVHEIREQKATVLTMDTFDVVLSALRRTEGVSIISNPKIIVTSGYTNALFRIGQDEPIIRTEIQRGTQDSPGDIVTANLDTSVTTDGISGGFIHTGIELKVIPYVKATNLIEALIFPKLTRVTGNKTVGNNSWPIMSVKQIQTKFTLLSGQTVAIGGLTDARDEKRISKIPLLGNVPLVGKYLFSHSKDVVTQIETIIFVRLALADPSDLYEDAGVPEDADLVYKKRIRNKMIRQQRLEDRLKLEDDTQQAIEKSTSKMKSRLLQRSK